MVHFSINLVNGTYNMPGKCCPHYHISNTMFEGVLWVMLQVWRGHAYCFPSEPKRQDFNLSLQSVFFQNIISMFGCCVENASRVLIYFFWLLLRVYFGWRSRFRGAMHTAFHQSRNGKTSTYRSKVYVFKISSVCWHVVSKTLVGFWYIFCLTQVVYIVQDTHTSFSHLDVFLLS